MRQWLRQHVFHNFGIKILALALAIVLYLHVFTSQQSEVQLDVPLELHAVPAGLTWSGELPATARVRFRGVGVDLLKLRARLGLALVSLDVGNARPGHYQRPLVAQDVNLPPGLRVEALEVISPRAVSLEFGREGSRRLRVAAGVIGRVAPGFMIYGRVITEPESVVVQGPVAVLDSMASVPTTVLDVTGESDMVTRRLALAVPPGCQVSPAQATVRVSIEKVATRTFAGLPVEVLRSRDVRLRRVDPETGLVLVSGPASVVESLNPDELRVSIDARGLPPGGVYSLMGSVELRRPGAAGSVSIEPVRPEKFEVELE